MEQFPDDFNFLDLSKNKNVLVEKHQQRMLNEERECLVRSVTKALERRKDKIIHTFQPGLDENLRKQLISELFIRFPNNLEGKEAFGKWEIITVESPLFPIYGINFKIIT
jgi:hypothetical protein